MAMNDTDALVYVVDDDLSAREGVAGLIRSAGLMAKTFASGEEFLAAPRPKMPSCLVLDVNLPGLNGLDLQQELIKSGHQVPIIFLSGHGDIPMTVRAVKAGAANFLTKPFDDEDLLNAVRQCLTSYLEDEVRSDQNLGNMVGESQKFESVLEAIQIVAPTDATVLIQGETGTGKELVARAIHDLSSRSKRPFIKVNCAAIPATLLESELFGHEKGSFTGAFAQKIGRFELAHQGTLFLDEIGEIPLELQPKLLRALQEQELERLGGNRTIHVDVRILAATNRNLKQMVEEGKFRSDLYYRLLVFPLTVPPLRERREDIPLLIRYFTQRYAKKLNRSIEEIPCAALDALTNYDWPGNIRELQNLVERSVILSPGRVLQIGVPDKVPDSGDSILPPPSRKDKDAERERILEALRLAGGKIAGPEGAAARLGLRRTTLQSRMKKMKIERQFQ
jgi:DNA-binding NtrC family response regulator